MAELFTGVNVGHLFEVLGSSINPKNIAPGFGATHAQLTQYCADKDGQRNSLESGDNL